ncbi:hypothetical protein GBA52_014558, partial [Prunus armeniaca]
APSWCLIPQPFQNLTANLQPPCQTKNKYYWKTRNPIPKIRASSNSGTDTSNPYYVHSSDHPGHMLVPTKLNGAKYPQQHHGSQGGN